MRLVVGVVGLFSLLCVIKGARVGSFGAGAQHGISGNLSYPNPNTILINDFSYDGRGLNVFLYFYRPGAPQSGRGGTVIRVSNEADGSFVLGQRFSSDTVAYTMPDGTTVCDIQTLTVWCEPVDQIFARVSVTRAEVLVDSGNGADCLIFGGNVDLPELPPSVYDNCISFSSSLQLSWSVDTPNNEIDFEICSCRSFEVQQNQYMGFGLSGNPAETFMVGSDVTIAWLDNQNGQPNAVDYFINGRAQCRGGFGVCPDTQLAGLTCVNNIDASKVRGGIRNGKQQCVVFSRNFITGDTECDIDFDVTRNQSIVWALGGLGETAFIHFERADPTTAPLFLGRPNENGCTQPIQCVSCDPFKATRLVFKSNTTFLVNIGPSGQERGYMAITGQSGWGIAWYVNGTLIPELVLERGQTYTFIIEGGNNELDLANYHPFYITSSKNGGRIRNTEAQRNEEVVYAGFNGNTPTGVGRLCQSDETASATNIRETCMSEADYFKALSSPVCMPGQPGVLTWTPDESTPNTVYYQCATHLNLGWKITLVAPSTIPATIPATLGAPPTIPAMSLHFLVALALLALSI